MMTYASWQDLHECMPAGECLALAARMQHIDNKSGCVLQYCFHSKAQPEAEEAPYPEARQYSPRLKNCHAMRLKKCHALKLYGTP